MKNCVNCTGVISDGNVLGCPNCGAKFCPDCAKKTKNICPHCYSSLEYIG